MLDTNYYLREAFGASPIASLFSKYFHKQKLKSLGHAIYFFDDEKSYDWINNEEEKKILLEQKRAFVDSLKSTNLNYLDVLKEYIYPNLDIPNTLAELSPKSSGENMMLHCPSCGKKEAYITNKGKGGFIQCNRENKCGESQSIQKYVSNRDNLSFIESVKLLADESGLDLEALKRNNEIHLGLSENQLPIHKLPVFSDSSKRRFIQQEEKTSYYILDKTKQFKKISVKHFEDKYQQLNNSQKLQLIYGTIKNFCQNNDVSLKRVREFFAQRELYGHHLFESDNVGFLPKERIGELEDELKSRFPENELIEFGILNQYGKWKYKVNTIDDKWKYTDAVLFVMHSPYTNIPTNLEFRFIGKDADGAKLKSVSLENSELVGQSYFGNGLNVDNLAKKESRATWFHEGALDQKTTEALGLLSCSLVGVTKHYAENLGYFRDRDIIIAFDMDNAGWKNSVKFAKKAFEAGVRNVYFASWNPDIAKDINELAQLHKLEEIKFSKASVNQDGIISSTLKRYPIKEETVQMYYVEAQKHKDNLVISVDEDKIALMSEEEMFYSITPKELDKIAQKQGEKKEVDVSTEQTTSLGGLDSILKEINSSSRSPKP